MTNKQKIEAILTAIRNAPGNEGLMELGFGCEVKIKGALPERIAGAIFRPQETRAHCIITSNTREAWRVEELKIIGHPVKWSDVLVALHNHSTCYGSYFVHSNGWLMWEETKNHKTETKQLVRFEFSQSPKENMLADPKITGFLADLLGVK